MNKNSRSNRSIKFDQVFSVSPNFHFYTYPIPLFARNPQIQGYETLVYVQWFIVASPIFSFFDVVAIAAPSACISGGVSSEWSSQLNPVSALCVSHSLHIDRWVRCSEKREVAYNKKWECTWVCTDGVSLRFGQRQVDKWAKLHAHAWFPGLKTFPTLVASYLNGNRNRNTELVEKDTKKTPSTLGQGFYTNFLDCEHPYPSHIVSFLEATFQIESWSYGNPVSAL